MGPGQDLGPSETALPRPSVGDTDEEEEEVRTQLRLTGLVLISAMVAACGGGVRGAGQGTTSSSAPDGTPVHSSSSEISGASAGSAEGR